jgi:hypothetical protein
MRAREMLDLVTRGHVTSPVDPPDTVRAREHVLRRQTPDLTRGLERRSNGDETLREPTLNALAADPRAKRSRIRGLPIHSTGRGSS